MNILNIPLLSFGNMTIATLWFLVTLIFLIFIFKGCVFLIKFALAADDEDAPDYKLSKNPFLSFFNTVFGDKKVRYTVEPASWTGKDFLIKDALSNKYSGKSYECIKSKKLCWTEYSYIPYSQYFSSEEDAKERLPEQEFFFTYGNRLLKILLGSFVLDTLLFVGLLYPLPVLVTLSFVTLLTSLRFLSKKVYRTTRKHRNHLSKHDIEIDILKEKVNEN